MLLILDAMWKYNFVKEFSDFMRWNDCQLNTTQWHIEWERWIMFHVRWKTRNTANISLEHSPQCWNFEIPHRCVASLSWTQNLSQKLLAFQLGKYVVCKCRLITQHIQHSQRFAYIADKCKNSEASWFWHIVLLLRNVIGNLTWDFATRTIETLFETWLLFYYIIKTRQDEKWAVIMQFSKGWSEDYSIGVCFVLDLLFQFLYTPLLHSFIVVTPFQYQKLCHLSFIIYHRK
jgi:hypothetical protein